MKKLFKLALAFGLFSGLNVGTMNAQCISTSQWGSGTANSTGSVTLTGCAFGGEYSVLTVTMATTYVFTATGGAGNYITVTDNNNVVVPGAFGTSPITVTIPSTGVYHVHISTNAACGTDNTCHTSIVSYLPPACSGAPAAANAIATSTLVCPNASFTLGLSTTYTQSGISYQWQSSSTGIGGPYTNVASGTNPTLVQSLTSTTWYRALITCNSGPATTTATPVEIQSSGSTFTTVPYFEGFEGISTNNQLPNCSWNASDLPNICKTYTAATGSFNQFPATGSKFASFRYGTNPAGDYFYSNGINLTAGVLYEASAKFITDGLGGWSEFSLLVGSNQSSVGLTPIASATGALTNTTYSTLANTFSVATTGTYYMAVKCIGTFSPWYLTWDDLMVIVAPANDASAIGLTSPSAPSCYSANEPVSVLIKNNGSSSLTNIPVNVNVTGAVTAALSGTYTGTLPPGGTVNVSVGTVNMSAVGIYSFNATTALSGDNNVFNDALAVQTRTVTGALTAPYSQNFNASTLLPAGMTATNYMVYTNHGANYNNNALSYNLYGTFSTMAQVTLPKLAGINASSQLTYDYRIQDWSGYPNSSATSLLDWADDSLNVYISTNCGASFTLVQSNNASNHTPSTSMVTKTLSLAPYTGNNIIVRFIAKKDPNGSGDYYPDLDNINITVPVNDDVSAVSLATPPTVGCYSSSEAVSVVIKNNGLLSQTNIPVTVTVTGVINQTLNGTYAGPLAPGATVTVPVGNINMLAAGVYSFVASTNLAGDLNMNNDTMAVESRTAVAALALPYSEDFNASLTMPAGISATNYYVAGNHGANYNNNALTYNLYGTFSTMGSVTLPKLGAVGAASVLKYDYRVQDWSSYPSSAATSLLDWANDSLNVFISTNCGQTFTMVQSTNATNHTPTTSLTTKQVNLGAYAGSDIIVRFVASKDPNGTGDYYLDIDNINICDAPSAPASAGTNICSGNTTSLTAVSSGSVQWYATSTPTNALATGTVYTTPVLSVTTTYYVSEMNTCGESTLTPVTVTVAPSPAVNVTATNYTLCEGASTALTATGANTYTWSNNATGNIIGVTPSVTTTYTVTGDAGSGCVGTNTVEIHVDALPGVTLTAATSTACVGAPTVALAGSPAGGVYTGSNVSAGYFNPSTAGTFMPVYAFTDPGTGCSNSASVTIIVSVCTDLKSAGALLNGISVYPNPSSGEFTVEFNNASAKIITVSDLTGRVVMTQSTTEQKLNIDLNKVSNGVYMLQINTGSSVEIIKLIKQ